MIGTCYSCRFPNLFYSFPFQIFEKQFLEGKPGLEHAYSDARAEFLEDMIEAHIFATGIMGAKTYRKVMWRDEPAGETHENDVVAVIGNTIFLFEVKPESWDDVARRGGRAQPLAQF